jgi:hypothetical protein
MWLTLIVRRCFHVVHVRGKVQMFKPNCFTKFRYQAGWDAKTIFSCLFAMPECVQDLFFRNNEMKSNQIAPAGAVHKKTRLFC